MLEVVGDVTGRSGVEDHDSGNRGGGSKTFLQFCACQGVEDTFFSFFRICLSYHSTLRPFILQPFRRSALFLRFHDVWLSVVTALQPGPKHSVLAYLLRKTVDAQWFVAQTETETEVCDAAGVFPLELLCFVKGRKSCNSQHK
jgi:hypothetical protein